MLLVLDVGNSNTVVGLFDGDKLTGHWRVGTHLDRTVDEYGIMFKELLGFGGIEPGRVSGISISCVVPPMLSTLLDVSGKFFDAEPLVVSPGIKTGMSIHVDNPREVGADRIVNAVAAYESCKTAVIVVDFGTATTFDFVTGKGVFEGGVISPGVMISTEALFKTASKLPRVEMARPPSVIGKNTVAAMQSGIVFGYAGLVDHIIDRIRQEIKKEWPKEPDPEIIATGGLASMLSPETRSIKKIDEHLTLKGLQIIWQRNQKE